MAKKKKSKLKRAVEMTHKALTRPGTPGGIVKHMAAHVGRATSGATKRKAERAPTPKGASKTRKRLGRMSYKAIREEGRRRRSSYKMKTYGKGPDMEKKPGPIEGKAKPKTKAKRKPSRKRKR